MGHQDQPDAGSAYADQYDDGDPSTDRRYLAAWSDLTAQWPGDGVELPLPLLELRFRVDGTFDVADLPLTGNACGGCRLVVQSAKVRAIGGVSGAASQSDAERAHRDHHADARTSETLGPPGDDELVPFGRVEPARGPDSVGTGRPRLRRPARRLRRGSHDPPSRLDSASAVQIQRRRRRLDTMRSNFSLNR